MAKDRRDSKNRLLLKGEYQKTDGRYMYRYTDSYGNTQFVYSWRLTKTDRNPKGKHSDMCLRDLEKQIAKDIEDGINFSVSKSSTLNDYFELYMSQTRRLKKTTKSTYRQKYDLYARDTIGNQKIADLRYKDIKKLYNNIVHSDGGRTATMLTLDSVLNSVFKLAARDDCIRNNPAVGVAAELKAEIGYENTHKKALSKSEQDLLIKYIRGHTIYKKWLNMVIFLLGTGCRIGEACGLIWDDCDSKNDVIFIRRSLNYTPEEHSQKYVWSISTPKTKSGIREIPMLPEVKKLLNDERMRQMREGFTTTEIDGVSGFVFSNRDGKVVMPRSFSAALDRIVNSYNKDEELSSAEDGRDPEFMPAITPHILRHTFCTRLCENEVNTKVVQEVMGHANIATTMNIYNTATTEFKKSEFQQIERKYKIM